MQKFQSLGEYSKAPRAATDLRYFPGASLLNLRKLAAETVMLGPTHAASLHDQRQSEVVWKEVVSVVANKMNQQLRTLLHVL